MKFQYLRKKLLTNAATAGGVVLVLALLVAGLSAMIAIGEENRHRLDTDARRLQAQMQTLEKQYRESLGAQKFYAQIQQYDSSQFYTLDSARLRPTLDRLKQQFELGNLSLNMSPPESIKGDTYESSRFTVQASTVELSFEGLSDEALLGFSVALMNEFNGYIHCEKLEISRAKELNDQIMKSLRVPGAKTMLASGSMRFQWIGLQETAKAEPAALPVSGKRVP
jgi:hypothetical protein